MKKENRRCGVRCRLCAALPYGETLSGETAGVTWSIGLPIICPVARSLLLPGWQVSGGIMDLAMAMGVALFGMFTASTIYFFYQIAR